MSKKRLLLVWMIIAIMVLVWPTRNIGAAYNDTTLEAGTVIYISGVAPNTDSTAGINISVSSNSEVVSMEVGSTSISLSMASGSSIHLVSTDRKKFLSSAAETACTVAQSSFNYTANSTQTITISFTDSDNCASIGGGGSSGGGGGGGSTSSDLVPPTISNIVATPTVTGATITWATNEASISWVLYGTTTSYGSESKIEVYKTSHSVALSGLTPLTTYHYQVKAKDSSGNASYYGDKVFTTLALGAVPVTPEVPITPTTPEATTPSMGMPSDNLGVGVTPDMKLAKRLSGRLLLQVEQGGAIWYVDTKEYKRYNVTFANALYVFQKLSLGITNANLAKIPVSGTKDVGNVALRNKLKGKLLLAVEDHGAIWYVDKDGYRHSVTWANLMDLFRKLALGITDANLAKIPAGSL